MCLQETDDSVTRSHAISHVYCMLDDQQRMHECNVVCRFSTRVRMHLQGAVKSDAMAKHFIMCFLA